MASFSRKRKFDESFSISSINCSKCMKMIRVEATSNVKAECRECLSQSTTENGGFPFEMVGDEHQLQKDFQCPICLLIIRDATELPCNHLMCKSCLVKNESSWLFTSCRVCRKLYDPKQKRFVKSIDRMIQTSLKVKCYQNDCDWIGYIQDIQDHKKKCEYVLVPCPFNFLCPKIQQKRKLIEAHKARCTHRLVWCEHCNKQLKYYGLETHHEICPEYPVVCPNDNCNVVMKTSRIKIMENSNVEDNSSIADGELIGSSDVEDVSSIADGEKMAVEPITAATQGELIGSSDVEDVSSIADEEKTAVQPTAAARQGEVMDNLHVEDILSIGDDGKTAFNLITAATQKIQQKRKLIEAHKARCTHRLVWCEHCNKQLKYYGLETHHEICPEYPVVCPNDNCNVVMKTSRIKIMENSNVEDNSSIADGELIGSSDVEDVSSIADGEKMAVEPITAATQGELIGSSDVEDVSSIADEEKTAVQPTAAARQGEVMDNLHVEDILSIGDDGKTAFNLITAATQTTELITAGNKVVINNQYTETTIDDEKKALEGTTLAFPMTLSFMPVRSKTTIAPTENISESIGGSSQTNSTAVPSNTSTTPMGNASAVIGGTSKTTSTVVPSNTTTTPNGNASAVIGGLSQTTSTAVPSNTTTTPNGNASAVIGALFQTFSTTVPSNITTTPNGNASEVIGALSQTTSTAVPSNTTTTPNGNASAVIGGLSQTTSTAVPSNTTTTPNGNGREVIGALSQTFSTTVPSNITTTPNGNASEVIGALSQTTSTAVPSNTTTTTPNGNASAVIGGSSQTTSTAVPSNTTTTPNGNASAVIGALSQTSSTAVPSNTTTTPNGNASAVIGALSQTSSTAVPSNTTTTPNGNASAVIGGLSQTTSTAVPSNTTTTPNGNGREVIGALSQTTSTAVPSNTRTTPNGNASAIIGALFQTFSTAVPSNTTTTPNGNGREVIGALSQTTSTAVPSNTTTTPNGNASAVIGGLSQTISTAVQSNITTTPNGNASAVIGALSQTTSTAVPSTVSSTPTSTVGGSTQSTRATNTRNTAITTITTATIATASNVPFITTPSGEILPLEASNEQINGSRMQIMRSYKEEVLRNKFHKTFSEDPKELYKEFQRKKSDIDRLKRDRKIFQNQYDLLLPPTGDSVDSKQFDVTLLMVLLINFCGYSYPERNWILDDDDNSEFANIVRNKNDRNAIQHHSYEYSDKEFNDIFPKYKAPLVALGMSSDKVDNILSVKFKDSEIKKLIESFEQSRISFNYHYLPPVKNFFSREDVLADIDKKLTSSFRRNHGVVLHGYPGMGKSEIARQYWNTYQNSYGNFIVWLNAANATIMECDFQAVGERCGLSSKIKKQDGSFIETDKIVDLVYRHFANLGGNGSSKNQRVLFVFDGADNQINLFNFLPQTIQDSPHILITSQCKEWDANFDLVKLDGFSQQEAYDFFTTNVKDKNSSESIKKLISLLSFQPMALQQAISYINKNHINVEQYLEIFNKRKSELMKKGTNNIRDTSVFTTLSLSIGKLEMIDKKAIELLELLAFLDGQGVAKGFIKKFYTNDMYQLNEILSLLEKYSIIETNDGNFSFDDQSIRVHQLTQIFMETKCNEENKSSATLEKIADVMIGDMEYCDRNNKIMDGKHWLKHFYHIQSFASHETNFLLCFQNNQNLLSKLYKTNGNTNGLLKALENISEHLKTTDMEHLTRDLAIYLITRHNIASCYRSKGEYDAALVIFNEVQNKQLELLGQNHPGYLTTRHEIASCYFSKGEYDAALVIFNKVQKAKLELLGPNHPDYLATRHKIAFCYIRKGEYDAALEIFNEVQKAELELLGPNHPDYLATRHQIASCYQSKGQYDAALEIFNEVQIAQLELLGPNHSDYLTTRHNIALCYMNKGEYDAALVIYNEVEKAQLELLGPNHPDYLTTRNQIALCYDYKGECDAALVIYNEVQKAQLKLLGPNHPNLIPTRHNIASCYGSKGEYDAALEIFNEVQKVLFKLFGPNHPDYLTTRHSIASCHRSKGEYDAALEIFNDVQKAQLELLGPNHPDYLTTRNDIASCYRKKGEYDAALVILNEVQKAQLELLGPNHLDYLTTRHSIASCYRSKGE